MSRVWAVLLVALATPGASPAQSSTVLVAEGIAAYRDLDFATAIGLLERSLAAGARPPLEGEQRSRALVYLGAAQLFASRGDHAAATFQRLVATNPTFVPDTLVFPPRVTAAYAEARRTTKAAVLEVPARSSFPAADSALVFVVDVSSPHLVTVLLEDVDGRSLATIANRRLERRTVLRWDGRDADGNVVREGDYRLRALSAASPGTALRSVSVPLAVRLVRPRPVPVPPFPADQLLPETRGGVRTPLAVTALTVGGLVVLPAATDDTDHPGPRIAIGATLALAGIAELLRGGSGTPVAENRAHNARVREQHAQAVAAARRQSERLGRMVRLEVRAGPPDRREGG